MEELARRQRERIRKRSPSQIRCYACDPDTTTTTMPGTTGHGLESLERQRYAEFRTRGRPAPELRLNRFVAESPGAALAPSLDSLELRLQRRTVASYPVSTSGVPAGKEVPKVGPLPIFPHSDGLALLLTASQAFQTPSHYGLFHHRR